MDSCQEHTALLLNRLNRSSRQETRIYRLCRNLFCSLLIIYCGSISSSSIEKSPMILSAFERYFLSKVDVTAMQYIPAFLAASIPTGAFSTTRHSEGSIPSSFAAVRYGSGKGLPLSILSPVITALNSLSKAGYRVFDNREKFAAETIASR